MAGFAGVRHPDVTVEARPLAALDLAGKRVAVVGGTAGIGRALARTMVDRGAKVTVVGRTFRDEGVERLEFLEADLTTVAESRRVAGALDAETLDTVVFTTGIMPGRERRETPDGIEIDLAVSYMSRLAILREIGDRLGTERPAPAGGGSRSKPRVFVMGFPGTDSEGDLEDFNSERSYKAMAAHMNTVAANEALVLDSAERYPQLNVYGLNPGLIKSDIRSNMLGGVGSLRYRIVEGLIGLLRPSADAYARRLVPVLFAPELESVTGIHFNHKGEPILPSTVMTGDRVTRYIRESETLLAAVPVR